MPASRSSLILPSNTKVVFDALVAADDFMTTTGLAQATKLPAKQVRPALWWLQKMHAVEAVLVASTPHWFATPALDSRLRTIDAHRKEDEPRNTRKRNKTPKA